MPNVIDQSYTSGEDNDDVGNLRRAANNNTILGHSFTPSVSGYRETISPYLKKKGSPTGNIWLEIRSDGADPTVTTQLGSDSENVDVSGLSTSFAFVDFTFTTPIYLQAGVEYWILLHGDYTETADVGAVWGTDTSSPSYGGGIAGRFGNGGAAWEDIATYDRLFKEYLIVGYTRGDEVSLPGNDNDLENVYSLSDVTDVQSSNNVRVAQTGTNQYMLHQFKDYIGSASACNVSWEGQTTWPPSSSTVNLQIYNRNTTTWETIDSDNTSSVNTDFQLSANIADTTNYKDSNGFISCRVYQQATF